MGIGDWGLGIGPNPQSPIPNPQSPIPNPHMIIIKIFLKINLNKNNNVKQLKYINNILMGVTDDIFSKNKLSLKNFDEILNDLIKNESNKKILKEIGLINEYLSVISNNEPNLLVYYSKNHKIIQNLKFLTKMRENFLEWAKYIFDITKDDLDSIQKFNGKIDLLKRTNLTKEYFQNNTKKYIFGAKTFNKLINYGFPPNLRIFIWDIIIAEKYNNHQPFNNDKELTEYRLLLSKVKPNPQIEKDIHRTFIKEGEQTPNNIQILKNILNCVHNYNPSGYCQGMNFIIGFLLKITNFNEIMTFYFFKHILNDIKGYFEVGLPLLHKNVNIFENYFSDCYKKIYKHFKKHEIINEFYISKWLQTLFTLSLPFEELAIIWDILLIRGFDFIIFICLALFDFIESDIIKLKESADIINYLEKFLKSEGENLIPINIKFFEQIDDYIIPLNEILEKAQELEKKYRNKEYSNNKINNNNLISDNQLYRYKFNSGEIKSNKISFKDNLNNSANINKDIVLNKDKPKVVSNFANNNLNNINKNSINNSLNLMNSNKNNILNFDKTIDNKPNYYSTKNLMTYNFNNFNTNINPNYQIQNNNMGYYQNNINPNMIYNSNKFLYYNQ